MKNLPSVMQAASYAEAGIESIRAGDRAAARQHLEQALLLDPRNEDAWLWLSGAMSDPAEQRRCLETLILLNPQHAGARRGLAILAEQEMRIPRAGAQAPLQASSATPSALPPDRDRDESNLVGAQGGQAAPTGAIAQPSEEEAIRAALRLLGKSVSPDEVCRMLCHRYGYEWDRAQSLLTSLRRRHARTIARRQSPYMLALSIAALVTGLAVVLFMVAGGQAMLEDPVPKMRTVRSMIGLVPLWIFGFGSAIGGAFGIFQTIGSLWAKNDES